MTSKLKMHVLFGCLLVIAMLISRILYTGQNTYAFIVWNMFLAFMPLFIAMLARRFSFQSWKLIIASAVWLLFFPNAPYLITDLYHLSHFKGVPIWYDALMLFTAAYSCVLMGFVSLRIMEVQWQQGWQFTWFAKWNSNLVFRAILILMLFTATGFGIYLGRELRYNSWDIITDTNDLVLDIGSRILSPVKHIRTWGFTLIYAVCLYFFYSIIGFNSRKETS
jgi:uncharacterized membrane protein